MASEVDRANEGSSSSSVGVTKEVPSVKTSPDELAASKSELDTAVRGGRVGVARLEGEPKAVMEEGEARLRVRSSEVVRVWRDPLPRGADGEAPLIVYDR